MLTHQVYSNSLPEHLSYRTSSDSALVLTLFVVCILLVAIARSMQKHVFLYLIQGVFFLKPLEDLSRESYKQGSASSVLILFQFVLITAGTVYWTFFLRMPPEHILQELVPLAIPTIYLLYQLTMSNLIARISGNADSVQELTYFTLVLSQFFGLLLLVELFVSYFQPSFSEMSAWVLTGTYVSYLVIRFLRGFWIVLSQGVSWYYIILYFWTLEILPLLVVGRLLYYDEFQAWIG